MAEFVNDKRALVMPAPNMYPSPAKDKLKAPQWSLPRDERFKCRSLKQPGPGEYGYASFTDCGPKFSTRVKPVVNPFKMQTKPGPGFYDPNKPKTSIHFSIRKKTDGSNRQTTPGPGAYEDTRALHYSTLPGSKIGKDKRISNHFLHTNSYKKQDPGRYAQHDFAGNKLMGVPNFSFGRDQRFKSMGKTYTAKGKKWTDSTPGPGSYEC